MLRRSIAVFTVIVAGYCFLSALATAQPEYVKRGVFTYGIQDREPIDDVDSVSTDSTQVYFFTEIVDMTGNTVTHRWLHDGETMAEVPFHIGGPRWRVYSSKKLIPEWTGTWKVEVLDSLGVSMYDKSFVYYKPE
jgi:hypothetical protein